MFWKSVAHFTRQSLKVIYLQGNVDKDALTPVVPGPSYGSSLSSAETNNTEPVSLPGSSPSARIWVWPNVFSIACFKYDAELELEENNAEDKTRGSLLSPLPKLKLHILERLAEEILKFKAYPNKIDLNDVAEALVKTHPCLREQGTFNWLLLMED